MNITETDMTETLSINFTFNHTADGYTAAIDGKPSVFPPQPSIGLLLRNIGATMADIETVEHAAVHGVSSNAVALIMLMTLRAAAANIDEQFKKDPTARLSAMLEVKKLQQADRIPYLELIRAVMASFSSTPLVSPASEADQLEAEILAGVLKP